MRKDSLTIPFLAALLKIFFIFLALACNFSFLVCQYQKLYELILIIGSSFLFEVNPSLLVICFFNILLGSVVNILMNAFWLVKNYIYLFFMYV